MAKFDKVIAKIGGKSRELLEKPLADALFIKKSGGEFTGPVTSTSTIKAAGGFFQESDIRVKENVSEINNLELGDIAKISTIYFNYISDASGKTEIGVIANELKDICPELVMEDENGYLNVDYPKLAVVALKGVKLLYQNQIKMMEDIQTIAGRINLFKE